MVDRIRSKTKSKSRSKLSRSKSVTLAPARLRLFGEPLLLEGENATSYDELLARICADVKPVDVIEEIFIADVVALEWEILRWRRLKLGLIRAQVLEALKDFLRGNLDDGQYRDEFADELTKLLQDNLPEDREKDFARTLAYQCAQNEPKAVDEVERILNSDSWELDQYRIDMRAIKLEELIQEYVQRTPTAITRINTLLAAAGVSMDSLATDALAERLDYIERIDRLTTIAENRRNTALREIDRRRAVLGESLRRSVQEIEDGKFEVIEPTPAIGKDAA
jgi:hypothetical protein